MLVKALLDELIGLTEKSISLAREESWDELLENESTRQAKVSEFEHLPDDEQLPPDSPSEQLQELIQLNENLSELCLERREALAKNIKQMSRGRRANKAYSG